MSKVKPEERNYYANLINNATPLFKLIEKYIQEELDKNDIVHDEDFDNPSWALKQAYKIGYKKGLTRILQYGIIVPQEKEIKND